MTPVSKVPVAQGLGRHVGQTAGEAAPEGLGSGATCLEAEDAAMEHAQSFNHPLGTRDYMEGPDEVFKNLQK